MSEAGKEATKEAPENSREIPMTSAERMDNARNFLVAEAAEYLSKGYIPNSGKGTVSTEEDGKQRIVGINDDQFSSTINWPLKASRETGGSRPDLELIDKTEIGSGKNYMERKQIVGFQDPNTIKDTIALVKGGKVDFELKGSCQITDKGSDCNYSLESAEGTKGTVHVATNKVENLTARTTAYDSTIHVKTDEVDMSASMKFFVARDTATYEYKKTQ